MFDHNLLRQLHRTVTHRLAALLVWTLATAGVMFVVGTPSNAQAQTRVQIDAVADHVHTLDDSYHRLHDGPFMNVGGGGVMVGLDSVLEGFRTHLRWTGGFRAASVFGGDMNLDWSHSLVMAGAGYGYQPWRFTEFYGKLSAGWSRQHLEARVDNTTFSQTEDHIALHPAVGAEFFVPLTPAADAPDNFSLGSDFTFGVNLEGGYYWQPAAKFDDVSAATTEEGFSGGGLGLGDLSVSGPTLSWGVFVRARFR